ncbi:hypothetical protein [Dactylosporangium sp. NPDC000521]|uniref:hypothetical protein n=1 Tax=Dactylosporangium sp. NPDC000521 TaxID=3363975 RepID=UPI0036998A19
MSNVSETEKDPEAGPSAAEPGGPAALTPSEPAPGNGRPAATDTPPAAGTGSAEAAADAPRSAAGDTAAEGATAATGGTEPERTTAATGDAGAEGPNATTGGTTVEGARTATGDARAEGARTATGGTTAEGGAGADGGEAAKQAASSAKAATEDTKTGSAAQATGDTKQSAGRSKAGAAKAEGGTAAGEAGKTDGATAQGGERVSLVKVDPFGSFAPVPGEEPSKARRVAARIGNAVGEFLGHEWTMAAVGSVLLAAVMTWPTLQDPSRTIPQDYADPTLQAWQMSWGGHILTTNPAQLWNANAFFPSNYSYAFSDTLLGYAPAGMLGSGPVAALVRYNIMYVLVYALAFFGAYVLARQLGSRPTGAVVAGAAFAYAPYRLGQAGHLHVLSIGGIALALAMLARGHGFSLRNGYQPDKRRWGWVLAGWLVASWQISLGFGIGIPFVYALLLAVLATAVSWGYRHVRKWGVTRPFGWKLFFANLGGGAIFSVVGGLMAYPYLQVLKEHPYARRSEELVGLFSPPLKGFFIAPKESWLWGDAYEGARATLSWAPEMALLPGFFLYGLAFAGLFVSAWRLKHRIWMLVGVIGTVALAMGTHGPGEGEFGYLALYRALPGFDGIRTSGRLVVWTTLFLALLAAGAVSAFAERAVELFADRTHSEPGDRAGFLPRLLTLIPVMLVLFEGTHETPHPVVPTTPIAMSTVQGPLMVLPSHELFDMNVMLWSTDGFPKIANGGSGFTPMDLQELRQTMEQFPDEQTVALLRERHIRTVVVVRSQALGSAYERAIDAPIDGLGLTRTEQGDVVLYKVEDS